MAKSLAKEILMWLLYASAGIGAVAYALFLRTRRDLRKFEGSHGLIANPLIFNPREILEQKLYGIEALRGLAIVIMLIGFIFWPVLFIGVLLFFFQTNAWKNAQRELFMLDRDHPEYKLVQQKALEALGDLERAERSNLESQGQKWQRVFAIAMGIAMLFAAALLVLLMTGSSTPVKI